MNTVTISTEYNKLDLKFLNDFTSHSYWGKGRTPEAMKTCAENSFNFGVYKKDQQIGYPRVVTDFSVFAYLMDVFIIDAERGKGYSVQLMNEIMKHPKLQNIKIWKLATSDAHGLYQKYGFETIAHPEKMMERKLD